MAIPQRTLRQAESFSPRQAQAIVNRFLLSQVGSVFAAGTPEFDTAAQCWRVPVLYNPPDFIAGEVGEAWVNSASGQIQRQTPISELHARAVKLYDRHQTQIRTAFLRARKK